MWINWGMDLIALIAALAALIGVVVLLVGAGLVLKNDRAILEAIFSTWNKRTLDRLEILEQFVETLPGVYEGFATEARKARQRATWHVTRVKKELDKLGLRDPELDELAGNLRPVDGEGIGDGELLALHSPVAESPPPSQADEMDDLARRKFGA